jgi:aminoglycoside/choline kinase family phosphotransferase
MGFMTTRAEQKSAFLHGTDWGSATLTPLAGDASNRRYDRLTASDGRGAVLMDAPPATGEDVRQFLNVAQHLAQIGLSAPEIFAADPEQGFVLLEDLGDALYARVLAATPNQSGVLYEAAIDALVHLQAGPPLDLSRYDAPTMSTLAGLVFEWYCKGTDRSTPPEVREGFCATLQQQLAPLDQAAQVPILRDYHAENLIWLPERAGVARVGLLDFQDAMLGHAAYDVVSLLQDARRDVDPSLETAMIAHFLSRSPADAETFGIAYALLGTQRALRILGVFSRLCLRDGKAHYVDLIPRVWGLLQRNLSHPALAELNRQLAEVLPVPEPDVLKRLKSQCAPRPMP